MYQGPLTTKSVWFVPSLAAIVFVLLIPQPISAQRAGHMMGPINFPVSCSPRAQTEFNRAVTLLHHMTYPQARVAFENIANIDPR
jgi:hypothetical protein